MGNYANLKTAIEEAIYDNQDYEITGLVLQGILKDIVNSLGADYQFMGVATPSTNPGTPDQNVAYIAPAGTYPNFSSLTIGSGKLGILKYNGSWSKEEITLSDATARSAIGLYYNTQAGDVVAKTVAATDYALFDGGCIKIHFNAANTASNPTLNVNGTGAKQIMYNGALVSPTNTWKMGETVMFYYDSYGLGQWVGTPLLDLPDFINVNDMINDSTEFDNAALARAAVPLNYRKYGLQITYLLADGWYTDQFIGDDTSDWGVADNWKVLGPVSVSQNTETGKKELLIGGIPALIVDNVPEAESDNLVKSGGVADYYGIYTDSQEWLYAITDKDSKIIGGIKKDGAIEWSKGVPKPVIDYCYEIYGKYNDSPIWSYAIVDDKGKVVFGVKKDGTPSIGNWAEGVPKPVIPYCNELYGKYVDSPQWLMALVDNANKILCGIQKDGVPFIGNLPSSDLLIEECKDYPVWSPINTTDAFKTPNDRSQVTCSLSYSQFLETYYNKYLGKDNSNIHVNRNLLGYDSGNAPIYEYDFIPQNYNRVVMLSAGMNACELTAIFGLAYFIQYVMEHNSVADENGDSSGGLAYIFKNVRLKVVPIICPKAFDETYLPYLSYNGVNINRNFNFDGNWDNLVSEVGEWTYKGAYPESEIETQVLKKWAYDNAHLCELWIDCHTAVGSDVQQLFYSNASNKDLADKIIAEQVKIAAYYTNKGYSNLGNTNCSVVTTDTQYGKTLLCQRAYKMQAMMIEHYEGFTGIGGNGLNCEEVDINNYVLMIRSYILATLAIGEKNNRIFLPNVSTQSYIENLTKLIN